MVLKQILEGHQEMTFIERCLRRYTVIRGCQINILMPLFSLNIFLIIFELVCFSRNLHLSVNWSTFETLINICRNHVYPNGFSSWESVLFLTLAIGAYDRLKLVWFLHAALDYLFFFINLFYQNSYKEAMNIGGGQIRGVLFNCFVVN